MKSLAFTSSLRVKGFFLLYERHYICAVVLAVWKLSSDRGCVSTLIPPIYRTLYCARAGLFMLVYDVQPSLRFPKEATCEAECAMKAESLRIQTKKRKQSLGADETGGNHNVATGASNGKGVKRALAGCVIGEGNQGESANPPDCKSPSGAASNMATFPPGATSPSESLASKDAQRRRFVWSDPLHQDFVAAVFDIGLKCASPKLLLEMMPVVDGLTSEHIKSHLQKYRLHRQRSREEFLKSYGYLTDLDGGKRLGGGSAAAAIKAAAAAAGEVRGSVNVKGAVSRCSAEVAKETGCGASCACEGGPESVSDVGEGGDKEKHRAQASPNDTAVGVSEGEASDLDTIPTRSSEMASGESTYSSRPGDNLGGMGSQRRADGAAGARGKSGRPVVTSEAGAGDGDANTGAVQVVASRLLLSHLELLARGIDMQIQFHHYLRQVVDSQNALEMTLLGQQAGNLGVPLFPRDLASPTLAVTGMVRGAMNVQMAGAGGGRKKVSQHTPQARPARNVGAGAGGTMEVPDAVQASPLAGQTEVGGIQVDSSPSQTAMRWVLGGGARRRPEGPEVNVGNMKPWAVLPAASSPHVSPALASAAKTATSQHQLSEIDQRARNCDAYPPLLFDLAALRAAVSIRPSSVGLPARFSPSSLPPPSDAGRRAYVPGEYILNTKSSDSGTAQHSRVESAPSDDGEVYRGEAPARNQRDARISQNGFAEQSPTPTVGHDPRTLQRHMQAQMEIQRTMLEAYVGQAISVGTQRGWNGSAGAVPAQVAELSGGASADTVGASAQSSGLDEEVGDGVVHAGSAAAVMRDQGSESLPAHPTDPGDSVGGFLPTDDVFGFDWLEHGGELPQGENAVPPRAVGETQSLFSFLM